MKVWILFSLTLFAAIPASAQVEPSASGGNTTAPDNSDQMMTPPAVSGQSYPTEIGSEQSNYIRGGLVFNSSYVDNLYAGSTSPVSEKIYTVLPTISFDETRPRQHLSFTYSPGFSFYEPSSGLNEVDQNLQAQFQYRLTPHTKVSANDALSKSSTAYGLQDSVSGGAVAGSTVPVTPGIVAPFAERLTNSASAQITYQFSPVGMVGGSGSQMLMSFPNQKQATGLVDSDERGGGGFYNRRMSAKQYLGANYQYAWVLAQPNHSDDITETHTMQGTYSIYLRPDFSISATGGAQRYAVSEGIKSSGWGPSVTASLGWQRPYTNFALSGSRQVTSGGGFVGVFTSYSVNGSARWQWSRAWSAGLSESYADNRSLTPGFSSVQSGHSISGQGTLGYAINKDFNLTVEYDRLHEAYSQVTALAGNPNSDRVMVSLAWQFSRPLGR
jgi:hypothetical protein